MCREAAKLGQEADKLGLFAGHVRTGAPSASVSRRRRELSRQLVALLAAFTAYHTARASHPRLSRVRVAWGIGGAARGGQWHAIAMAAAISCIAAIASVAATAWAAGAGDTTGCGLRPGRRPHKRRPSCVPVFALVETKPA